MKYKFTTHAPGNPSAPISLIKVSEIEDFCTVNGRTNIERSIRMKIGTSTIRDLVFIVLLFIVCFLLIFVCFLLVRH